MQNITKTLKIVMIPIEFMQKFTTNEQLKVTLKQKKEATFPFLHTSSFVVFWRKNSDGVSIIERQHQQARSQQTSVGCVLVIAEKK